VIWRGELRLDLGLRRQVANQLGAVKERDRRASEPSRRMRRNGAGFIGREHPARLGSERGVFEPKRMADDDARIKLGRVETAAPKLDGQLSSRRADRAARERPPRPDGAPSA